MTANTSITYDVPGFGFLPFDSYVMVKIFPLRFFAYML
jgi:hypothetical protein